MRIVFVIGPPCAGKSTYIRKNFQDAEVVDLYDFQENCRTVEDVARSYDDAEAALRGAVEKALEREKEGKDGGTVVLEHTLLMAKRRPQYVNAVRSLSDCPIEIRVVCPDKEEYARRCRKAGVFSGFFESYAAYDMLEPPKEDEGFSKITFVE